MFPLVLTRIENGDAQLLQNPYGYMDAFKRVVITRRCFRIWHCCLAV